MHTLAKIRSFQHVSSSNRLTDDQTQTRLKNQVIREKKKGIVMKDRSKRLMGMNVYITNTSPEEVPTNYVHSLYSLRWQIEILFRSFIHDTIHCSLFFH